MTSPASTPALPMTKTPAAITRSRHDHFSLAGNWTARGLGNMEERLAILTSSGMSEITLDGAKLEAIDTVGVWLIQRQLQPLRARNITVNLLNWPPRFQSLMELIHKKTLPSLPQKSSATVLERIGMKGEAAWQETLALLSFVGECALVLMRHALNLKSWRGRQILYNIQHSGFDALPLIGLTSFLLGIVVAYQGADQLKLYSANIFVVDLVGLSMLREFAPLITAILIAGRSGSAYAAQIGTMVVTDEVEALRTIGMEPIEVLVWPKIFALMIALPLLTVFADMTGVLGGMIMASLQLDIGFPEFLDRFGNEIPLTAFFIGVGKALIFAVVIAVIGCFQGFRTQGNADSVGRQTTRSVVQSIFIMIVADAIFSIIFSMLNL